MHVREVEVEVVVVVVVVVIVETDSSILLFGGMGGWGGLITCFAEQITADALGLFHFSTAVNFEVC